MNETVLKFGYPETLIKDYKYWVVLLRPKQVTIGSLILAYKPDVNSLSDVSSKGYAELSLITKDIELNLKDLFGMEKINYMALMMVDKNVHFHIIPRYSSNISFNNKVFADKGWPGLPDLSNSLELNNEDVLKLRKLLSRSFDQ